MFSSMFFFSNILTRKKPYTSSSLFHIKFRGVRDFLVIYALPIWINGCHYYNLCGSEFIKFFSVVSLYIPTCGKSTYQRQIYNKFSFICSPFRTHAFTIFAKEGWLQQQQQKQKGERRKTCPENIFLSAAFTIHRIL